MVRKRQRYRSQDALLAGVCSGVAERHNLDPLAVRLLAVSLSLATCGIAALVYCVLWRAFPVREDCGLIAGGADTLGDKQQGSEVSSKERAEQALRRLKSATAAAEVGRRYSGMWQSPEPAVAVRASVAHTPPAPPGALDPLDKALPVVENHQNAIEPPSFIRIGLALCIGSLVLFSAASWFGSTLITNASWWQLWPMLLMIWGLFAMALSAGAEHRMVFFVAGLVLCNFGIVLLMMSLGVVSWESWRPMLEFGWVFLCIAAVSMVAAAALRSPVFLLIAGLSITILCLVGLIWFNIPGQPLHFNLNNFVLVSA